MKTTNIKEFIRSFVSENPKLASKVPYVVLNDVELVYDHRGETIYNPPTFHLQFFCKSQEKYLLDQEYCKEYCCHINNLDSLVCEDKYQISVDAHIRIHHDFMFDKRLIPKHFKSVEIWGTWPSPSDIFPAFPILEHMDYRAFEKENIDKFIKFVRSHMHLLQAELELPNADEQELLDALFNGFDSYKKEHLRLYNGIMKENQESVDFYKSLLIKTGEAYQKSDIKNHEANKADWAYSVTATRIEKGQPLIIGFNWGADAAWEAKGNKFGPQDPDKYPIGFFKEYYDELGSFKRTIPYFEKYYDDGIYAMQTNFCFFRSAQENQISQKDIELSKPLFHEYLKFAEPTRLISFSSSLRDYFIEKSYIDNIKTTEINYRKSKILIIKGDYIADGMNIPYVYLPHPNAMIKRVEREKAWEFCFEGVESNT
jgi:hypothetical protein